MTTGETLHLNERFRAGSLSQQRLAIAASLGHSESREILGSKAPALFSFESMLRGGDRQWRVAMRALAHRPLATAACEVAQIALSAYKDVADAPKAVTELAKIAVAKMEAWRDNPESEIALKEAISNSSALSLAVAVGGTLHKQTGRHGQQLGHIIGLCYSVIAAPENPRYVRWLGEAADRTTHAFAVPKRDIFDAITKILARFALAE